MTNNRNRFLLDHRKPRRKFTCPSCGGKKCFSRYIDTSKVIDFPDNVGKCDHENSCGYHYPPREYFKDNPTSKDSMISRPFQNYNNGIAMPTTPPAPSFIDWNELNNTLGNYSNNPLYSFLATRIDARDVDNTFHAYQIGTSPIWGGSTVYWQIDISGKIRTGKIICYDPNTGKRIKHDGAKVTWMHSHLRLQNFNLVQCLFGVHLLNEHPDKRVALVEGEKTALIASCFMSEFVWVATGSKNNLAPTLSLAGRDVIVFPDLGAYDEWNEKLIPRLKCICKSVVMIDSLERIASPDQRQQGLDIADYFLR